MLRYYITDSHAAGGTEGLLRSIARALEDGIERVQIREKDLPARDSSRLDFGPFALTGPYIPGHFRGDSVWVAVHAEDLRVHSGDLESQPNFVSVPLVDVSHRARSVLLEFSGGIFADVSREEFARQKDNKGWLVEFPPGALHVL